MDKPTDVLIAIDDNVLANAAKALIANDRSRRAVIAGSAETQHKAFRLPSHRRPFR